MWGASQERPFIVVARLFLHNKVDGYWKPVFLALKLQGVHHLPKEREIRVGRVGYDGVARVLASAPLIGFGSMLRTVCSSSRRKQTVKNYALLSQQHPQKK
jgi:hypothetical protein